jgi:hypothetical protein
VLVVAEGSVLAVPYALAVTLDRPVAELWGAALVVRFVEWATIFVVSWRACWPALRSLYLAHAWSRRFGPGSTLGPRRGWPWSGKIGGPGGSGAGARIRG